MPLRQILQEQLNFPLPPDFTLWKDDDMNTCELHYRETFVVRFPADPFLPSEEDILRAVNLFLHDTS